MSAYSKDLCIVVFNEASNLEATKRKVKNAFLEGFMCFRFEVNIKGKPFEDRVALPVDADEACAEEMAEFQFQRFENTVREQLMKRS